MSQRIVYRAALTVALNNMPDSLFLPILQSAHMTDLAAARSNLYAKSVFMNSLTYRSRTVSICKQCHWHILQAYTYKQ